MPAVSQRLLRAVPPQRCPGERGRANRLPTAAGQHRGQTPGQVTRGPMCSSTPTLVHTWCTRSVGYHGRAARGVDSAVASDAEAMER